MIKLYDKDLVRWLCIYPHQLLLIVIIAIGRLFLWPFFETEFNFPVSNLAILSFVEI